MHFLNRILLLVLLGGAVFTDLRSGKIYNTWLIPLALSGALLRIIEEGLPTLPILLLLFFLTMLFLFPFYRTGGLGAGDIKFLMAVSAYLQPAEYASCLMAILCLSAIYALILFFLKRDIHQGIHLALPIAAGVLLHVGGLF